MEREPARTLRPASVGNRHSRRPALHRRPHPADLRPRRGDARLPDLRLLADGDARGPPHPRRVRHAALGPRDVRERGARATARAARPEPRGAGRGLDAARAPGAGRVVRAAARVRGGGRAPRRPDDAGARIAGPPLQRADRRADAAGVPPLHRGPRHDARPSGVPAALLPRRPVRPAARRRGRVPGHHGPTLRGLGAVAVAVPAGLRRRPARQPVLRRPQGAAVRPGALSLPRTKRKRRGNRRSRGSRDGDGGRRGPSARPDLCFSPAAGFPRPRRRDGRRRGHPPGARPDRLAGAGEPDDARRRAALLPDAGRRANRLGLRGDHGVPDRADRGTFHRAALPAAHRRRRGPRPRRPCCPWMPASAPRRWRSAPSTS